MNLIELREAFKRASGFLYWEDVLVDEAINNGIKFLDSKTFCRDKVSKVFKKLELGSRFITIPMECKVIKDVWITDSVERQKLEKVTVFPEDCFGSLGTPSSYYPFSTETYEKTMDKMFVFSRFADIVFSNGLYRGIVFDIQADKDYSVIISGRFNSLSLTTSFPTNWWSVQHGDLVVTAAMYVLDINRRNSSGGAELSGPLLDSIREINNDSVEEEVEDISSVMEG